MAPRPHLSICGGGTLCSRSQEARDARAVLFYCVGALRTSRAQSERQVNGVRKAQLDFNRGEVIKGACSIDCSSLHLDKHQSSARGEAKERRKCVDGNRAAVIEGRQYDGEAAYAVYPVQHLRDRP